ncbi:sulfatase [soil metagenome]
MRHAPRLRRIMGDNGVTFDNSFVTNSLCCPSRATSLRGQYAHNHGIRQNSAPLGGWPKFSRLGREQTTIATWLQAGGYQTFFLGKYLNNYEHTYVPPGWDEWYGWMGFYDTSRNQSDQYRINHNGQVLSFDPEQTHDTDLLAARASEYIRQAATDPSPFFLYLSLNAPHQPAPSAVGYRHRFRDSRQPRTAAFNEADVSDKPAWVRRKPLLDDSQIARVDAVYRRRLRSMLSVEDAVATLISALEDTGRLDNTYLVFTSDNGHHNGHRRQMPQKMTAYDEDIRVPLLVRGPGVPAGVRRRHLVVNNDVAPTIADLAGVDTPAFVDGRSFERLLHPDPPASRRWRKAFVVEKWGDAIAPPYRALRTRNYLFVRYPGGERELYGLRADPHQVDAIAPGRTRRRLSRRFMPRLDAIKVCAGQQCRTEENVAP